MSGAGFGAVDPQLTRVNGLPRASTPDVGAIEASSSAQPLRLPLTAADVGPAAP